jgi:thioredoxin-related protein
MFRPAFVLPLLLLPAFAQEKGDLWIQDFAKAKETAKAEKKDLLIDFTGSDWCGWCIKLDEEVFSQDPFKQAAPKDFILVKLDFPQDESRVTPEIKAQNEKLRETYGIQGYPTILLTDAEGQVYGEAGYQEGGPEKYVEMLAEAKKKGQVFQAAMLRASQKKDAERATALDEALSAIDASIVKGRHLALVQEIVKLDADGKAKVKAKYEAILQEIEDEKQIEAESGTLREMIGPMMQAGEGAKALTELDTIIAKPKNKAQHQVALFFKAMVSMDVSKDPAAAIKLLEAAKAVMPNSPIGKQVDFIVPQLQKEIEGGKGAGGEEKK